MNSNETTAASAFKDPLFIIIFVMSVISFIMGSLIIIRSLLMKRKLSATSTMILHLIFISVLHTISYSLNWVYNKEFKPRFGNALCNIQAYFMIATTLSQELWLSVITVATYNMFINNKGNNSIISWKTLIFYLILCYLFPLVWTSIYASKGYLGVNYINCWLKNDGNSGNYYGKALALYINKWVNFAITILFSIKILRQLYKYDISDDKARQFAKSLIIRVFVFPAIQIIESIVPTVYTVLTAFNVEVPFLSKPMLIIGASMGVLFPIVYISFKNVRKELFTCDNSKNVDLNKSLTSIYSRSDSLASGDDDSSIEIGLQETN